MSFCILAQLIVRNLDATLIDRLKHRAALNGRSAEAEHRAILQNVLLDQAPENFKAWLLSLADLDVELPVERSADKGRSVDDLFT